MLLNERSDALLRRLVEKANTQDDTRIPILLSSGGVVVIGALGSAKAYWKHVGDEYEKALARNGDEYHQIVGAEFRRLGESITDADEEDASLDDPETPRVACVHVRDATVYIPAGYTYKTPWWRAKLTAIDGYSLNLGGSFNLEPTTWRPGF